MAEKVIAIKIEVQGTKDQQKKLEGLQANIDKITASRKDLNRQIKDEGLSVAEASKKRANYNLQLKANRNALRDVEADILKQNDALRKNSGFVEGIKIALRELEEEEKKLTKEQDKLNKELKEANTLYGKNSKQVTKIKNEYNNVSNSIKNVKNNINNANKSIINNNKTINNNITNINKLGGSFKRLGSQIGTAFVGLFAVQKLFQIISDGVETIKDFEQQMATVKAITGATGEEFNKLEKSAKDLGSSTEFTASQVGKLQEEYAKLGFNTQEILDASEATLELATATGSDLAQSAKVAAATINGFGLEAKDTQKIVDIMAKSFTNSALDLSKFETAMASVAPVAATVGFSIEKTTASLGTLTDAGFDASTAGTALRNILLDTQKAGLTTSEAFKKIRGSLDPAATALDLFGKRGAAVAITLANNEEKTKAFATSLENAAGSAKQMAAVVGDTLEGDLKRLSSAFEGLILGSAGTEFFRDITQGATELISTLSDLTTNTHEESDALEDQRIKTNLLVQRILRLNEGSQERAKLVNELNVLNKDFLKNLDQENLSNEVLAKRLKEVNKQLVSQILIKREDEKLSEKAEDQADAEIDRLEAEADLEKQLLTIRESKFKGISEEIAIGKTQLEQAQELLKVLDEQSIRTRTQTSFGGSVESTNLQADAADKLRGIINSLSVANREVNEQNEEANKLAENREKLLKKLGIEENANLESKKKNILVNTNLIDSEKEVTKVKAKKLTKAEKEAEKEAKRLEAENKRKLKAEERFLLKVDKLKKSSSLLAIEDERKLQLEKLRLQKEALEAEAKLKIGEKGKLDSTLLSLTSSFKNKEDEINKNFNKKQKLIDDSEIEKESLKKQKKIDDIISVGQFALNSSSVLIDSLANIELQKEKDKLDNKLITEKEFAVLKYNIEKKAFERQKKVDVIQAIMNGALGVTKAFAQSGILGAITGGIVAASTAVQVAAISKQKYPAASFADGGFTGSGSGIADETGFKQAGIVHEGEYVVPKHVLGTSEGSSLVGALENMRTNQPMPNLGIGYANGGMVGGGSLDLQGLRKEVVLAVSESINSIQVTNVATETTSQAIKVNNIEQEASFG